LIAAMPALAGGCGDDEEAPADPGRFDAERAFADLEAQVEIGPRPAGSAGNREAAELIAEGLRRAGVEDIEVQRPYRNVVGTIPGSEPGAVVIGAHYDTKDSIPGFVGANDGASGVAVVLELARSLPSRLQGPSLRLAFFDAEEARGARPFEADGTRGSRQYVEYAGRSARGPIGFQGAPKLNSIRAMVLFDLVGDCDLEIPLEGNSDPELYGLFADAAEESTGSPEPFTGTTTPIADDHQPFAEAGIPAVDLIDFAYGPGSAPGSYWHTAEDTVDKVCAESLDAVGEAAVAVIPELR
jgi:Zn-dependent M28 family amino/carboxypeptidase